MKKGVAMLITKIKRLLSYNLLKTLYVNFRLFPLKIACKLPLQIGWRVELRNVFRGCIVFDDKVRVRRFMVRLGITPVPMISTKSDYTLIRFGSNSRMMFGDNVLIHNGVSLIASENGNIQIGSDTLVNQRTKIYSQRKVSIGNHCSIGWECQIMDSDCHLVYNENKKTIGNPIGEVHIGDNVWLASKVSIMKGVTIPSFSIISGNSVVLKSFADVTTKGNLFVGSPAILKLTGVYRLLNDAFEMQMKKNFMKSNRKHISEFELENFNYKDYLHS